MLAGSKGPLRIAPRTWVGPLPLAVPFPVRPIGAPDPRMAAWVPTMRGGGPARLLTGSAKLQQSIAGDPEDRPVVHRPRAKRPVELDRRRIPIEHRPLEAAAATLDGNARQFP